MLEFENQMLLDVLNGDSLLIAAKGLSIEIVVLNLIRVHCDPGNLVLVMGATPEEEEYFISQLRDDNVTPLPKVITSDVTNNERVEVYLNGGVLFISSRILVVDLLKKRVPVANITGFIVLRAHRILNMCQEAFALRLFRQENNTGFINAFSKSPMSFTLGMLKLDRIMKTLFTNNLHLWPRFHETVKSSLKIKEPAVIELRVPLSSSMNKIHSATIDLIDFCIKEIKRVNPSLSTEDITVENALSKSFHKMLQLQLDPIWNQLSGKTKQLVADLKILRSVLVHLTQSDCVRLHRFLSTLRSKEYVLKNSGWMMYDSAETLFVTAKSRLFDNKQDLSPEGSPKWDVLNEVLLEIQKNHRDEENNSNVLILVDSPFTIKQLKEVLTMGSEKMLTYWYYKFYGSDSLSKGSAEGEETAEDDDEGEIINTITLTQRNDPEQDGNATFTECPETSICENNSSPVIMIRQFKKDGDGLSLPKILSELKPKAIIMYDIDVSAIRQIEIYQTSKTNVQMLVYFLIYDGSMEEQAYLTILNQENKAFEFLINEKKTIVMEDPRVSGMLTRDSGQDTANTRKGGGQEVATIPRVIVDMREFRSELPSLLHKRGIEIEPITLQIGDYIISPEMCVERKSLSDLIGSLNSGRLYTQALSMTRHYSKPILLIEFDESKPFAMQGRYYLSTDVSSNDIRSKLQLLTIHFPKLRIVWSPSPFASAQLLHELKDGKEEPSASIAAAIGVEETAVDSEKFAEKFNSTILDFVRKLPGVNSKNINILMNKGVSLDHLITLTMEDLSTILSNKVNGELLYNALHKTIKPAEGNSSNYRAKSTKDRIRGRGRGRKRPS